VIEQSRLGLLDSYGYAPSQAQEEVFQHHYESQKGIAEYFGSVTFAQGQKRRLRSAAGAKQRGQPMKAGKHSASTKSIGLANPSM